jgi:hypothetical protein
MQIREKVFMGPMGKTSGVDGMKTGKDSKKGID